jgi:hypothetical protein
LWKNLVGTVSISAVGMFGDGAGWGIPAATPTALTMTVGGIGTKHVTIDGQDGRRYRGLFNLPHVGERLVVWHTAHETGPFPAEFCRAPGRAAPGE